MFEEFKSRLFDLGGSQPKARGSWRREIEGDVAGGSQRKLV